MAFFNVKFLFFTDEEGDENEEEEDRIEESLNFDDMYVGKLIDVVDYLSKWTNAIVTNVDFEKEMIQVVVDGDLEMEFTKADIVS